MNMNGEYFYVNVFISFKIIIVEIVKIGHNL